MRNMRISAILATTIGLMVLPGVQAEDRGAEIFNGFCNRCHGSLGQGNATLHIEAPLIAGMPAWYVEGQLLNFRNGIRGTHPKDIAGMRMRPMAKTLKEEDLPNIAAYVANLPVQTPMSNLAGADSKKGAATFTTVCVSCHGADAKGNQSMGAPALAGQDGWYLLTQLKNFKASIRGGDPTRDKFGPMMRSMVLTLDEAAMNDVAAYLQSLSKK